MGRARTYTKEQFIKAVEESFAVSEALRKLNLSETGSNYKQFYKVCNEYEVSTDHFMGQAHLKGKSHNWSKKKELKDILKDGTNYPSHTLKLRLIKEGYKEHKCECCGKTEWMGKEIPIQLDHINGKNTDNRIENLRILCPNCHAQTETFAGKNKKSKIPVYIKDKRLCIDCGCEITRKSKTGMCFKCYKKSIEPKQIQKKRGA